MSEVHEKPLLTFVLVGYNQERFIEEAIEGAFAQTYSPLEIILSDDCSQDTTYQVMQRMVASYQGRHRVILNRNESNRGIGGQVNRVFDLARGQLIVVAAGDDISLPERTQVIYEAWEASHRKAMCIYSGQSIIDAEGRSLIEETRLCKFPIMLPPCDSKDIADESRYNRTEAVTEEHLSIPDFFSPMKPVVAGSATAYSPRLMSVFGPLRDNVGHEDEALLLRAVCLGSLLRLALPLVKYRLHDKNMFSAIPKAATSLEEFDREERRHWRIVGTRYPMYGNFILDLETARRSSLISQSCFEWALEVCRRQQRLLNTKMDFHTSSFVRKCRLLLQLKKQGLPAEELRHLVPRLLPESSYYFLRYWKTRLHL